MSDVFIVAGDYLKGKSVYPIVRRLLNLLFSISIASFFYEKAYGSYTWFDYSDYKATLDFFIKGTFFIPFSIFVVVHFTTQFVSILVFALFNHFRRIRTTRKILLYQFKKDTIDKRLREITKASKYAAPSRLSKSTMIALYGELRKSISTEAFTELEKGLKLPKQKLEANFTLAFRMLIAITVYFMSLPQFSVWLYTTVLLIILLVMYLIMIAHVFLDVLPTLARKLHEQAEEYLRLHNEGQERGMQNVA